MSMITAFVASVSGEVCWALSRPRTGLEEFTTEVSVELYRDLGRKLGKTRSEVWINSSADRDEYGCV